MSPRAWSWKRSSGRIEFTLQDFRDQLRTLQKMGPLSGVLGMLPGMGALKNVNLDDGAFKGVTALIDSMTPASGIARRSSAEAARNASPKARAGRSRS